MSDNTKAMAHEEAEEMKAVDRYLLKELTAEQRSRFEEHYFECEDCAEAVVTGQVFVQGIHHTPSRLPRWKSLQALLATSLSIPAWRLLAVGGAAAAFVAVVGVREFDLARQPQANTTLQAVERVKGESDRSYAVKTESATVEVVLPYDSPTFSFYRVRITSDQGKTLSQVVSAPAGDGERRLSVHVTRRTLGTGLFTVSVEGLMNEDTGDGKPVETYFFSIKK